MSESQIRLDDGPAKRVTYLDAIRGVASLIVVLGHAYGYSGLDDQTNPFPVDLGRMGIIAFFLVSGYVVGLSLSTQSARTFWIRRFFRLYPSYWLCLALFIALNWPVWNGKYELDAQTVALNFLMIQGFIGATSILWPTWTLGSELVFYAQQSVLKRWLRPSLTVHIGWLWLLLFAVLALATRFTSHDFSAIAPLVLFTASVGLAVYLKDSQGSRVWIAFAVGFVVAVPILGWVLHGDHAAYPATSWTAEIFDLSYLAGGALFLSFYLLRRLKMPKILLWLGDLSFALYLVHAVVLLVLTRLNVSGWPLIGLTVAASVGLAWVLHNLLEVPFQNLGRRLSKRQSRKEVVADVK